MTASRTRAVAVVVIVVAFVALAVFALLARAYQPGRDGVRVPNGVLALTLVKKVPNGAVQINVA